MIQTIEGSVDLLIKKLENNSEKSLKSKSAVQKPRKKWITPALLNSTKSTG